VKEVQIAFQRELMTLPWLEEKTRKWAVKKASEMKGNIGYAEWIRDAKKIDNFYGRVSIPTGYGNINTKRHVILHT
jgi:predicted metalloendopeptidase